MPSLFTVAKNKYVFLRGFHTNRRMLLIESDDWGSIRTPNKEIVEKLASIGDPVKDDAFLRSDCLENEEDLNVLFDVLKSVKDCKGRPAVMTANFAMANPAFEKIDSEKDEYFYEPFYDTYNRYYGNNNILKTIKKGIADGCFYPQLHCREHMNVGRWMADLKSKKQDVVTAFRNNMIGIGASFSQDNVFGYMDAFNTNFTTAEDIAIIVKEATKMFFDTFGYKSETFVASCFVWDRVLEKELLQNGITGIQSSIWQNIPKSKNGINTLKRKLRFTGQKNTSGQIYTVRNCKYEPAYFNNPKECRQQCLEEISQAFKNNKPAIINSHRVNYIGRINPSNAQADAEELGNLLKEVISIYGEVEFISTPDLVKIIREKK